MISKPTSRRKSGFGDPIYPLKNVGPRHIVATQGDNLGFNSATRSAYVADVVTRFC
jgi:hypothetical protein